MAITFQVSGDIGFSPRGRKQLRAWVSAIAKSEGRVAGDLSFVFMSDAELLKFNRQYLSHDEFTDIITFDYSEGKSIHGDILVSIDRVRENASRYHVSFDDEIHRVIAHGVLHLCGFKDKTAGDAKKMRAKEDEALHMEERPLRH